MTDKELKQMLASKDFIEKGDAPQRKNITLVLSPHIVRNAAILKKRRQDRIQVILCALSALLFLTALALLWFLARISGDLSQIGRYALTAAAIGMVLTLICAPALVWHEEKS